MNRMFLSFLNSMQTNSQNAQNPGLWVNGNRMPIKEENAGKIDRNLLRKGNEEQDNLRNFEDEPVLAADGLMDVVKPILSTQSWPGSMLGNPAPKGGTDPNQMGTDNVADIEQGTRNEEAARLAATAKAHPDLTDRMKQDPRNHAALIRAGKMTQQEADSSAKPKSTNRKQDDGYNPGGLMSGQYMPKAMQENTKRLIEGQKTQNEQDDDMIIPDTIKARNVGRGKGHVVYDNVDDHSDRGKHNLRGYAPESTGAIGGYKPSGRSVRPVASPQPNATPMQENTNRSMFLTHLQSMQTNSQNSQNPGLWVNGNRMPVQESLSEYYAPDFPPGGPEPGFRPRDPRPYDPMSPGYRPRPGDFIKPRPRTPSPDWNPDYPYPKPGDEYRPRPRLPGLINPKPKSPTEITVDDIINPNTGNVSLSTGEANKPGAVTLHPEGQNILNPPATPKIDFSKFIRPRPDYNPEESGFRPRPKFPKFIRPDYPRPDPVDHTIGKNVGGSLGYRRLKPYNTLNSSGEPLGIIPPTDPNLMNRMY